MPLFIIETTAESPIREFWQVEAESAQQARDKFEAGQVGAFLWDEVMGDETEREVAQVHPRADLAGTISLHNAQQEAPAMLAALRKFTSDNRADNDGNTVAFLVPVADYEAARAILARIDGAPTAQPSAPSGEAARDMPISEATRAALVGYAEDSDMWNAPSPEMVAQLLDLAGIERRPPSNVFTAFCQEADGTGTIWIQQVKAETIADATAAARRDCAEDWGFDVEQVHCLGLAQGDCRIVHWQDLCDGEEG